MPDRLAPAPESQGVIAALISHLVGLLDHLGIPADPYLSAAGLSRDSLTDPGRWIPISVLQPMIHAGERYANDALVAIKLAGLVTPATFGVLGYLTQSCSNLREIFDASARYERLVSDIGTTSLLHRPGITLCCWDSKLTDPVAKRLVTEFLLGAWRRHVRLVRPHGSPTLLAVHFRHDAPEVPGAVAGFERFFGCPVRFSQTESALLIRTEAMTLPLLHADAQLHDTLEQLARARLSQRQSVPRLTEQVRTVLQSLLPHGTPSRERVATQLDMSSRTLHRKLQEEGSNYREILDELRMEYARALLRDDARTIAAVAIALGFMESQSFIRWFRAHEGQTPGEYRKEIAVPTGSASHLAG